MHRPAARVSLRENPTPEPYGGMPVRLFTRRNRSQEAEVPCPRCKVLVPVGDDVCNVCGWDMLDKYREPEPEPTGQEDRPAS